MIETIDSEALIREESKFEPSEKYSGEVLLMLDFDGVVHSLFSYYDNHGLFDRLHYVEAILREMPNVKVVISSSWARKYDLVTLKKRFAEDVRKQVAYAITKQSNNRHNDVKNFLQSYGLHYPWIAVDDMAKYNDTDPVVWTDWRTGLTDQTAKILKKALQSPLEYKEFRDDKKKATS
jgi:hypothetical protein